MVTYLRTAKILNSQLRIVRDTVPSWSSTSIRASSLLFPVARPTSGFSSGGFVIGYGAQRGNAFATVHNKVFFATCTPEKWIEMNQSKHNKFKNVINVYFCWYQSILCINIIYLSSYEWLSVVCCRDCDFLTVLEVDFATGNSLTMKSIARLRLYLIAEGSSIITQIISKK